MTLTNIGNPSAIKEGNEKAHDGDVITDVCLLQNGLMTYRDTFRRLYCFQWKKARGLLSMLFDFSMPSKARAVANRRR